ncbi:DUF6093 family protein [Aeromicrobium sp. Leaf291]|uniref:DUF6093 family protein n=1 Tax=Aeromicrobium sp. Leaf291 TaxID=1736325 RepID=UPI0006FBEB52|nr:DUF6093 family protein [Aeromicrobium sp. Leaf291]KQP81575.1 hypothetical protein ASF35_16220 [Aeromicrobium sp. Leaf291]
MSGLELGGVRTAVDLLLAGSAVLVIRDHGASDDVLNQGTGKLEPPPPDLRYSGPAGVVPAIAPSGLPAFDTATTPDDDDTTHRLLLPLVAPDDLRSGDLLRVDAVPASSGDPALVGRWFEFTGPPSTSMFAVVRIGWLKPTRGPTLPEGWAP